MSVKECKNDQQKYNKDEALAKINTLISNFYERVGREDMIEIDTERSELVEDIEDILNNTDISTKHIIIETLELEKELKKNSFVRKNLI